MPSPFRSRALAVVSSIPVGTVMSYGDVAAAAGAPRAARQVGYALADLAGHTDVPWHRVVRASGALALAESTTGALLQRARLEAEGVPWRGDRVDIGRCRHVAEPLKSP